MHKYKLPFLSLFIILYAASPAELLAVTGLQPLLIQNRYRIDVEVVGSTGAQRLGLGNRDSLPENRGMLFIYHTISEKVFWMKGMRFPIDIIWLLDGEIVSISKDVQTETIPLTVYRPEGLANQVIEVNAGFSDDHGLFPGDRVDIIVRKR